MFQLNLECLAYGLFFSCIHLYLFKFIFCVIYYAADPAS